MLGAYDRRMLFLTACWSIVGTAVNSLHVRHPTDATRQFWLFLSMQGLWAATAGIVVYSLLRRKRSPASYGFSFGRGGVVSLAMLAAIHIYLAIAGKLVLSAAGDFFLWSILGAFLEELVFRAIAIGEFILLMNGMTAKPFWAILASSALWLAHHIPSKSPAQLCGLFLASLIMGYVYYKSRSILLPAWIHVVANAGYLGGIWIAALYCVVSLAGCGIRSVGSKHKEF
jgi:membrane protease YdiL (CAAX protease family)